jgi:adenine-specific DNA-methyltransferase
MHEKNNHVKTKGEVFTPPNIAAYMASFIDHSQPRDILEPSCGDGAILNHIPSTHRVTGVDIQNRHVKLCQKTFPQWTFLHRDFTRFHTDRTFDYVIGNPPYVKLQNLAPDTSARMQKEFPAFIYGNTNLFVYFIVKCLSLLRDTGKLIFIVPNTILYNKSQQVLKHFLMSNRLIEHIVDFKDEQVFENATTYTCILVLTRKPSTRSSYTLQYGLDSKKQLVSYDQRPHSSASLRKLFTPRIGLMTLADDVFIIKDSKEKAGYLHFTKGGKDYAIERDACMDIFKVSKNVRYKIIYPYVIKNGSAIIDHAFLQKYPLCGKYLRDHKARLDERDSGNVHGYPTWYAYGRTQALVPMPSKTRVFLPTVVRNIRSSYITTTVPLFYSGLYLEPCDGSSIATIKKHLIEHETRILQQSNHRAGGWFALSHGSFA